jgi:hypothetical protein
LGVPASTNSLEGMLRLLDARTGSHAELTPSRPGLLRVCAHVPQAATAADITALRILLIADLLARTAELEGLQVLTALEFSGPAASQAVLESYANELAIHPPTERASFHDSQLRLADPIDVHLVSKDASVEASQDERVVSIAAAHLVTAGSHADAAADGLLASQGHSSLSIRLALMSLPGDRPAELTQYGLASADDMLAGWRQLVARWAESPSRPIPASIMERARSAFVDLDTVSALALLHDVSSDAGVLAGAKFEAFVYADRILGLDLARDVGRSLTPG